MSKFLKTTFKGFFDCAMFVKANPEKYKNLTLVECAIQLQKDTGEYISADRIKEVFEAAGVKRPETRGRKLLGTKTNSSHKKIRSLACAIIRLCEDNNLSIPDDVIENLAERNKR